MVDQKELTRRLLYIALYLVYIHYFQENMKKEEGIQNAAFDEEAGDQKW